MSQSMTFDELEEASPMFKAFRGQLDAQGPHGRSYDLTALWKAAGRPRGHAPRHYLHRFGEARQGEVRDQGGGPDGAVLADYPTALHYCMIVDRRIMLAVIAEGTRSRRRDPVKALMECPDPLMALLIETDFLGQGVGPDQAERILIDGVKQAVAGLDEYSAEYHVAKIQRVLASLDPNVEPPPELDLLG